MVSIYCDGSKAAISPSTAPPHPHTNAAFLKHWSDYLLEDTNCYTSMVFYGLCKSHPMSFLHSCRTDVRKEPTVNSSDTRTLSATCFNQTAACGGRELVLWCFRWWEESSLPFQLPGTSLGQPNDHPAPPALSLGRMQALPTKDKAASAGDSHLQSETLLHTVTSSSMGLFLDYLLQGRHIYQQCHRIV